MQTTTFILSIEGKSCKERKINKAIRNATGVDSVDVFPDTNRVVVKGNEQADPEEIRSRLQRKLGVTVTIVSQVASRLELTTDEDEDDNEEDDDDTYMPMSSLSLGTGELAQPEHPVQWWPWNPSGEWYGMGLPATPTPQPEWGDQPVPDPTTHFFQPSGQWYGMGLPAIPTPQPAWDDQPVPDPTSHFFQQFGNTSQVPPENESSYMPFHDAGDQEDNTKCSIM